MDDEVVGEDVDCLGVVVVSRCCVVVVVVCVVDGVVEVDVVVLELSFGGVGGKTVKVIRRLCKIGLDWIYLLDVNLRGINKSDRQASYIALLGEMAISSVLLWCGKCLLLVYFTSPHTSQISLLVYNFCIRISSVLLLLTSSETSINNAMC